MICNDNQSLFDLLTVVIPTFNEEKYIYSTLESLDRQVGIDNVDVIIADGGSTDKTVSIINSVKDNFKYTIHIIDGGSASVGRNAGSKYIKKPFILFLDADTTIDNELTIFHAIEYLTKSYKLVTCKIRSVDNWLSRVAFKLFEFFHSKMKESFSTGVFFMTDRNSFEEFKGFDESLSHTEDYILSRKYKKESFYILNHYVTQDSRRFKKMGYINFLLMLVRNYINRNNIEHFKKNIGYW